MSTKPSSQNVAPGETPAETPEETKQHIEDERKRLEEAADAAVQKSKDASYEATHGTEATPIEENVGYAAGKASVESEEKPKGKS